MKEIPLMPLFRTVIFCLLFALGFGAMSISLLAKEFDVYYSNKQYKEYVDNQIEQLKEKRVVYSDKLSLLYGDPTIKQRLGRSIFGVSDQESETFFPEPDYGLEEQSITAVSEIIGSSRAVTPKPKWVFIINKELNRKVLLYGGIAVAALSMFFFVEPAGNKNKKIVTEDEEENRDDSKQDSEEDIET